MRILIALLGAAFLLWATPSPAQLNNSTQKTQKQHESLLTLTAEQEIQRTRAATLTTKQDEVVAVKTEPELKPEVVTETKTVAIQEEVTPSTGCEKYRDIIDNYSWNVDVAIAVCNAESSGNTNTSNLNDYHSFANCRGSFGLFQINCSHGRVYDPVENVRIAAAMYEASNWRPWSATTCKYKVKCY